MQLVSQLDLACLSAIWTHSSSVAVTFAEKPKSEVMLFLVFTFKERHLRDFGEASACLDTLSEEAGLEISAAAGTVKKRDSKEVITAMDIRMKALVNEI